MSEDLNKLIDQVAHNRLMPRDEAVDLFKKILSSWGNLKLKLHDPLEVEFNEQEEEVKLYCFKHVVEEVADENSQISFLKAVNIKADAKLGDDLRLRVEPHLVKTLLPGAIREFYLGIREDSRDERMTKRTGQIEYSEKMDEDEEHHIETSNGFHQVFEQTFKTDILCEICGSVMMKRRGEKGYSLVCSSYPKCSYIRESREDGDNYLERESPCEKCGSPMVLSDGGLGMFWVCSNPACKFTQRIEAKEPQTQRGYTNTLQRFIRIPDLPEPITGLSGTPLRSENNNDITDDGEVDTPRLISILVNEDPGKKDNRDGEPLACATEELILNPEKVLINIETILAKHDSLKINKKSNHIQVEVQSSKISFTTIFDVYDRNITVKSLLPFIKDAASDLLELCEQPDFTSRIGKVSQRGDHFYVIKSSHPLKNEGEITLWDMVWQSISDAEKAAKIIESYIDNEAF